MKPKLRFFLLIQLMSLFWMPLLWAETELNTSPASESQHSTLKTITIRLRGAQHDQHALKKLHDIVQEILKHSKLEHTGSKHQLEIVIHLQSPSKPHQPYKVNFILPNQQAHQNFNYRPEQSNGLYNDLKAFLTQHLNLIISNTPEVPKKPNYEILTETQYAKDDDTSEITTPISSETEIQLKNMTPAVKSITVKLQGSVREQDTLHLLHAMVKDILQSAKLEVIRVPVAEEPIPTPVIKVYENLEILIQVKTAQQTDQPLQIQLSLQGDQEQQHSKLFDYYPGDQEKIYEQLRAFLVQSLNLTLTKPAKKAEPSLAESLFHTEAPVTQKNKKTEHVSSETEIQLKSMTPTVKSITVKLQGSVREQDTLHSVHAMVKDILQSSKLEVIRVPVQEEPLPTPVIKVHENLEIVIKVKSPEHAEQPFQIGISLQEEGHTTKPQFFDYYPENKKTLYEALKHYLTKQLNLISAHQGNLYFSNEQQNQKPNEAASKSQMPL
ncbi:MAG: hypothetical protein SVR94_11230 [Pseudomonadota bacterium]|nr:hypothetical protein [Pseudomonadota bacterium]